MLSTDTAREYGQELEKRFFEYRDDIYSFNSASIWTGNSKDSICGKANEFYNEFKSSLTNQVDNFSSAVISYNNYMTAKNNYEASEGRLLAASRNYDNAVNANDLVNADYYRQVMLDAQNKCQYYSNDMKIFKNLTEKYLAQVSGVKLGENDFIYYNQNDYNDYNDYNNLYGYSDEKGTMQATIASGGCGPTSMAMVATYLLGEEHDPVEMAQWSLNNGYRVDGKGTAYAYFGAISDELGISCVQSGVSRETVTNALANGKTVIVLMGPGDFTSGGHYIVLRELDEDGRVIVADPNSQSNSERTWSVDTIISQDSGLMWAFDI